MPAIQTSYPLGIAKAFEGMIANSEPGVVVSRIVESAAGIGFGKVAARGADDDGIIVSAAVVKPLGITVADSTQVAAVADVYPQYSIVGVMTKGVIWVIASVAVADGDPVYFVPATGVFTNVSSGNIAIPNAVFDSTTTTTNQLAKVRLA